MARLHVDGGEQSTRIFVGAVHATVLAGALIAPQSAHDPFDISGLVPLVLHTGHLSTPSWSAAA